MILNFRHFLLLVLVSAVAIAGTTRTTSEELIDFTHSTTPANPDSGKTRLYMTSADQLFIRSAGGNDNNIGNVDLTSEVTNQLPIANGGTNATSKIPAFDNLSPMTTKGDLITSDSTPDGIRLAIGTDGQVLTADSTQTAGMKWAAAAGGSSVGQQEVFVHTGNGFGSTATKRRRYSVTVTDVGSDLTLADTAANGTTVTINTTGFYCVHITDRRTSGAAQMLGVANGDGTTALSLAGVTMSQFIAFATVSTNPGTGSGCKFLTATDVVAAQGDGSATMTSDQQASLRVWRVL